MIEENFFFLLIYYDMNFYLKEESRLVISVFRVEFWVKTDNTFKLFH